MSLPISTKLGKLGGTGDGDSEGSVEGLRVGESADLQVGDFVGLHHCGYRFMLGCSSGLELVYRPKLGNQLCYEMKENL